MDCKAPNEGKNDSDRGEEKIEAKSQNPKLVSRPVLLFAAATFIAVIAISASMLVIGDSSSSTTAATTSSVHVDNEHKHDTTYVEVRGESWKWSDAWYMLRAIPHHLGQLFRRVREPPCECLEFPRCLAVRPNKTNIDVIDMRQLKVEDYLCTYMCPCTPVLLDHVFDVWPGLSEVTFDYLHAKIGDAKGKTRGFGTNPYLKSHEGEKQVTLSDMVEYVKHGKPRTPEGRYSHFNLGSHEQAALSPLFLNKPSVMPEPGWITIGVEQSGNKVHDDGAEASGLFCVTQGAKGYVLYHQLDYLHVCEPASKKMEYEAIFPGESVPRRFEYNFHSGSCIDIRFPREEQTAKFPTVMEAVEFKTIVQAGQCLLFPAGYIHGLWNEVDSVGLNLLHDYDRYIMEVKLQL